MNTNRNIEFLARGVCVQNGQILLCRNRRKGNVYLPGGHIEWGESAKKALARELREELGVAPRVGRFLGACESTFVQARRRKCELNVCFRVYLETLRTSAPVPSQEKKIEFFWWPIRRLKNSGLLPGALCEVLPLWLSARATASRCWTSNYRSGRRA